MFVSSKSHSLLQDQYNALLAEVEALKADNHVLRDENERLEAKLHQQADDADQLFLANLLNSSIECITQIEGGTPNCTRLIPCYRRRKPSYFTNKPTTKRLK